MNSNNCFNYCLMPSEIARLVYGYCLETGCTKSAQCLLEESPYLKEFAQGIKNGYPFSTKINNQSLLQVLNGQWHQGPMFGSTTNHNNAFHHEQQQQSTDHSGSINVLMPAQYHDLRDNNKIPGDHYSTPKHKILYSMHSGNNYSPRRKNATPKRLTNNASINHPQQHYNQQQQRSHQLQPESQQSKQYGVLSQHSCDNSQIFSSPLSSNDSSEAEIEVQPKIIFDELLKCGPLHAKVANTIQKLIHVNKDDNPGQTNSTVETNKDSKIAENSDLNAENMVANKHGNIEKDLIPSSTLDDILDTLTEDQVFNDFVEMVVEKEIANTPFKLFQTPGSCSSSGTNNSLNTPYVVLPTNGSKNYDPKQMPVKNIMKEMEEQQHNNQPANTMMDSEYLQKIDTTSPPNNSNNNNIKQSMARKTSEPKENLKMSNSQQQIMNSNQNFTKIRPVLQNHDVKVAMPKYTKFSQNQQEVQQAFNIAPLINVNNNVTDNDGTKTEPIKSLTTTIEIVPSSDNNEKKESNNLQLGSNVENVISQQQINNTNIDVLSAPVNWPSNTITTQPIIIPNNQLAWDNNNGLVYLSYPSNDTIYYIDSQQIPSSTITTINNDNFVNTTPITITTTSQNILTQSNLQESVASNASTTMFSDQQNVVDEDVRTIEQNNNVEQKQQQQQQPPPPKPSRPIPSILAKGKHKNSSSTLSGALKSLRDSDNLAKNNSQVNHDNTPQTKKPDDNHKLRRKLEPPMFRSENMRKRKLEHEEMMKKRRNSLHTSDEKIKTILDTDLEKFLVDIHKKDEKEK